MLFIDRETHQGISVSKVKAVVGRLGGVELERILSHQHVEFATECLVIDRFVSERRHVHRRANGNPATVGAGA